jgi:hypothetical protein
MKSLLAGAVKPLTVALPEGRAGSPSYAPVVSD